MRWRIGTLMLIVLIAALVAALFVQQRRISRLEAEIQLEIARSRAEAAPSPCLRDGRRAARQTAQALQQTLGSGSLPVAKPKSTPQADAATP